MRSLRPLLALLLAGMMLAGMMLAAAGCSRVGTPNGSGAPPDRTATPAAPSAPSVPAVPAVPGGGTGTPLLPPLEWPPVGAAAPAFRLLSLIGGEVSLPGDFRGRAVMLLFFSLG